MNKMNYLFDACVSHRNTLRLNKQAEEDWKGFAHDISNEKDKIRTVVYRVISKKELKKANGQGGIYNDTDWSKRCASTNVGICFFSSEKDARAWCGTNDIIIKIDIPSILLHEASGFYFDDISLEYGTRYYDCRIANIKKYNT